MRIITAQQGTPEWEMARCGVPTASCFDMIFKKDLSLSKSRKRYIDRLRAEKWSGRPFEGYSNQRMEDGLTNETKSIATYEYTHGVRIERVGFCLHDSGLYGCSPDGLIGADGGFETKDAEPHIQEKRIKAWTGAEYHRQVMGNLLVTGRKWWDLVSHCDGMEQIVIRFERDEEYMKQMHDILVEFCKEVDGIVKAIS